ncbi:acyl carrier protein [Liquorilactobacillus uvarum]|uniref:acyl carrier protein n=1 Tax=Liquorilactobacillus uvarum TaxID=303240 RepID=UPI00288C313C|nr:acyl carrier protein [Liquorilactobacillus uvarum]
MTEKEIFNKIAKIIHDRFELDQSKITPELTFSSDLDADSIDIVEFVLELEDTFGAEIPDEDAEKLLTVGDVVKYIEEHQA